MDNDELRQMRMQHYWDQQQAAMDEIRRLIADEQETAIGKVELSDKEIHNLMTQYSESPIPEWEWAKLIVEAGRPINGPPMMISWVDEVGVEERSTLASQLFWFQAGWRAHVMQTSLRVGDRATTREHVSRIVETTQWLLKNQAEAIPYTLQVKLRVMVMAGEHFIESLDALPKEYLDDDDA